MSGFSLRQTGKVGDMTLGRPPVDYVPYPYFEWYSEENGRVVLELDSDRVELMSQPIPFEESDPISREEQEANMAQFLRSLAEGLPNSEHSRDSGEK